MLYFSKSVDTDVKKKYSRGSKSTDSTPLLKSSSFSVFEAGLLNDSFPFLVAVLCIFIKHCKVLQGPLLKQK